MLLAGNASAANLFLRLHCSDPQFLPSQWQLGGQKTGSLRLLGIALICPGNGRQMSGSKRKPEQAKRWPCWPSIEFQSSYPLLSSAKIKCSQPYWAKLGQAASLLGKEAVSRRGMPAGQYPGRAAPASVPQAVRWGEGCGEQREEGEKKMNPCHPRPQKHLL